MNVTSSGIIKYKIRTSTSYESTLIESKYVNNDLFTHSYHFEICFF